MPDNPLILAQPIRVCLVPVVRSRDPVERHILAPVVIHTAHRVCLIGRVLHDDSIVETAGYVPRSEVHLSDVRTMIPCIRQILNPAPVSLPVLEAVKIGPSKETFDGALQLDKNERAIIKKNIFFIKM